MFFAVKVEITRFKAREIYFLGNSETQRMNVFCVYS